MTADDVTAVSVDLFRAAVEGTADLRSACVALIGAAAACSVALGKERVSMAADDLLGLLCAAGEMLIDDHGGMLAVAQPAGTA